MNDILFMLIRASLTASLSDRDAFIERVAQIIEAQTGKDEEAARKLSNTIAGAMEGLNGTLLLQQLFGARHDKKLNKNLDSLTQAIEKLSSILEKNGQTETPPSNNEPQ